MVIFIPLYGDLQGSRKIYFVGGAQLQFFDIDSIIGDVLVLYNVYELHQICNNLN